MDDTECVKSESYNTFGPNSTKSNFSVQNELRQSADFCDAFILLEDGGRIPIHRVILCSASDYFQYVLFQTC